MRILVAGQPRTGTSALLEIIHGVQKPISIKLYEPTAEAAAMHANSQNITVKMLLHPGWFTYINPSDYDKVILLIRDPRDTIISTLLWWVFLSNWKSDPVRTTRFISLLQQKERHPSSVPLLQLIYCWGRFEGKSFMKMYEQQLKHALAWHDENHTCFTYRYTDLVDDNRTELGAYFKSKPSTKYPDGSKVQHYWRTGSYDNWKHWFTVQDVAFFRPFFEVFLKRYEMIDDWSLADNQHIDPETGSSYLQTRLSKQT